MIKSNRLMILLEEMNEIYTISNLKKIVEFFYKDKKLTKYMPIELIKEHIYEEGDRTVTIPIGSTGTISNYVRNL